MGQILSMVVMLFNVCNQSDFNRKECLTNWDEWLYPELVKGWDLKTGKEKPDQQEREEHRKHEQTKTINE